MRKGIVPALLLSLASLCAPARASDPQPAEVRRVAQEVLADGRFQRDFPDIGEEDPPKPDEAADGSTSDSGGGRGSGSRRRSGGRVASSLVFGAGPMAIVLSVLLWIVFAAVLVVLAISAFRAIREHRRVEKPLPEGVAVPAVAGPAPPDPLGGIDRLAEEGRFAEAIHALLLRAIHDVRSREGTVLPDNLTSREVLDAARIPAAARDALGSLVGAVELAVFGRRPADREGYAAARLRYVEMSAACLRRSR